MPTTVITPYSSALPFIQTELPTWVGSDYDSQRLASYDLYDDLYRNSPNTYNLLLRGADDKPIYVPTTKRLINTLARYVGRGWGFSVDSTAGSAGEQTLAKQTFSDLFVREDILATYHMGKREWLRRGDWIWYVLADPDKAAGSRLTIKTIDPRNYFPITDDDDVDRLTGAQLIEEILLPDDVTFAIKVQSWYKPTNPRHPQFEQEGATDIAYESYILDLVNWRDDKKRKVVRTITPLDVLDGITAVPLYHIKNNAETGDPFGVSEVSGLESLLAAINQTVSDDDLSLAMAGLGMYTTDSGAPRDADTGKATDWQLGPAQVIEVGDGKKFERVAGINTITPMLDHIRYMEEQVYGTSGVNDIALGSRGAVTESGVALAIRMQPLFDNADDKDLVANGTLSHMFHDLKEWFLVYESIDLGDAVITASSDIGDRLPFDRDAYYKELTDGYTNGWFSLAYVHKMLVEKLGYQLSKKDLKDAIAEADKKASQAVDQLMGRSAAEAGDTSGATPPDTTGQ